MLTADPIPFAQLDVRETRIQNSVYPKWKYIQFNKGTTRYNLEVPLTSSVL